MYIEIHEDSEHRREANGVAVIGAPRMEREIPIAVIFSQTLRVPAAEMVCPKRLFVIEFITGGGLTGEPLPGVSRA